MDEVLTMREIAASSSAKDTQSPPLPSTMNLPLLSAFLAFSVAQFLKIFTTWFKEKRWDSRRLLGSGGMPSSHSATVVALATAIGLQEGTAGSSFALAIVLASVGIVGLCAYLHRHYDGGCSMLTLPFSFFLMVMYDASGIRLHAGRQAELLNQIVCELPPEHPLSSIRPLRELLGHTPLQVVAGAILGFLVSYLLRNS